VDAAGNLHDAKDPQLWRQAQVRADVAAAGLPALHWRRQGRRIRPGQPSPTPHPRPTPTPPRPQVSAFVRSQLYEPEMTLNGGCLDVLDPLPTPAAEAALLAAVEDLYARRVLPGALDPISVSQGFGAAPEHADVVLFSVLHHFRSYQRWPAARAFFARLGATYPAAAVWEAAALRAMGRGDAVIELLGGALERSPSSPLLLTAMATECMRLQQVRVRVRARARQRGGPWQPTAPPPACRGPRRAGCRHPTPC
jgi:hypothetical protein